MPSAQGATVAKLSDAASEDIARLMAELARHGKGINSPEVARLRELLAELDRVGESEARRNPNRNFDIDTVHYLTEVEGIQGQILHEFAPYYETMRERYVRGRRAMVWIGRAMYIAGYGALIWLFFWLLGVMRSRSVQGIVDSVATVIGYSLGDALALGAVVLAPMALSIYVVAVGGHRLYTALHRDLTGRDPPKSNDQ
jgi:hypothetical protein